MSQPRVRREPPPFRRLHVRRTEVISPHMTRVVLGGAELKGFQTGDPAASVRLLLPINGELVVPKWNGNEFLHVDAGRAVIRTLTPHGFDPHSLELQLDVVLHGSGVASTWASSTRPGDAAAVSGPGRGYRIDTVAPAFLLAGDETAIPAICQLLEHLPDVPIVVHLAVRYEDARVNLHRDVDVTWHVATSQSTPHETLSMAIRDAELVPDMRIWAAGEAAEMQRIRKHLFDERDLPRSHATVRGYWRRNGRSEMGDTPSPRT